MSELRSAPLSQALKAMSESVTKQRVGIDAVHIPSWMRYLEIGGDSFLHRVYVDAEHASSGGHPERLAARFAAKEAVLKVLGCGISGVGLGAVEIANEEGGRPFVRLHGGAAGLAETLVLSEFELSICHEQDYALAIATARQELGR